MGIRLVNLEQEMPGREGRVAKAPPNQRQDEILAVRSDHRQRACPTEVDLGRCDASSQARDPNRPLSDTGEVHGFGQEFGRVQEQFGRFLSL
jgi:hypothetical protein